MGTDIHGVWQKKTESGWEDIESTYEQYRHYLLFAWLAGVRNGYGFAGTPTHTPVTPVAEGRGLPGDFVIEDECYHPIKDQSIRNPSTREYYPAEDLKLWMGDHSFSWATADEILAAELPIIWRTGIIDIEQFKSWDQKSTPESWCGGIGGMDVVVDAPDDINEKTTHVRVYWREKINESLEYFTDEVLRLKDLHGEVRFVFGFDS